MLALLRKLLALVLLVGSYPVGMAQAAPFSPKLLGAECVQIYRDWLTQEAPRAFAVAANNTDCGASWSHLTADEARADALERCNGTGAAGCAIVAEDATPPVTAQVGNVLLIRGCATDYENWTNQTGPKSFYSTQDGRSCGAAWNGETLQQTRKEARRLCQQYGEPCSEIAVVE